MMLAAAVPVAFPPDVALQLVKLACELPDSVGKSLSVWTCAHLARTLMRDGIVETISPQSIQRILLSHQLKPWRVHHWLNQKTPRDEAFKQKVLDICDLYTRQVGPDEIVLSYDEKTSLQPRTRSTPTRPAQPGKVPVRLEHEYARKGALHLFAAFDTRTGKVFHLMRRRKRQIEFIEFLELIDRTVPATVMRINMVGDNVSVHHGKLVHAWLALHPRFRMHFTPVHCSWMNQVEQWFSILQRQRFSAPNFRDLADLEAKVDGFIADWNTIAHPFQWTRRSFDKVLAKADAEIRRAANALHPHASPGTPVTIVHAAA